MNCLPVACELSRETETIQLDILIAIFHCHDIVIIFYSRAVFGKKINPLRQIIWEALAWDVSLLLHHDVSKYLQTAKMFPFDLLQAEYLWFPQFAAWFSDTLDVCFWCLLICLLEKAMATHSNTLAWKIPWTGKPGRLQSMWSLRLGHDWVTSLSFFTFMHWRRKWQPAPVFLPGESQGQRSLVGCRLWSRTESDTTEAT